MKQCFARYFAIIIVFIVTGSDVPGTAQGAGKYGSLTGCVRDSKTERALFGAQVTLSAGLETYRTKTDKDGHYFFTGIPGGTQFPVSVSCPYYKDVSTHVSIQQGAMIQKDIKLSSLYLHLLYPNGGEKIFAGSEQHISWVSVGITSLRLEFSINSGRDWQLITAHTDASSGSYIWDVPDIPSSEYLIRVTDTANENIYDISDSTFSNDST